MSTTSLLTTTSRQEAELPIVEQGIGRLAAKRRKRLRQRSSRGHRGPKLQVVGNVRDGDPTVAEGAEAYGDPEAE